MSVLTDAHTDSVISTRNCKEWLALVRIGDIADTEQILEGGILQYKVLGQQIKQLEQLQGDLKRAIANTLDAESLNEYTGLAGTARYREGYDRISYDATALDTLAQANAELAELINPHRKQTTVGPSLAIS